MPDRDKVIKGLEYHLKELSVGKTCFECPYYGDNPCEIQLIADAIAMLKEQEAVKPILEQDSMVCGVCGHEAIWQKMLGDGILVDETLDYCPHCGRSVKWDG